MPCWSICFVTAIYFADYYGNNKFIIIKMKEIVKVKDINCWQLKFKSFT